MDNEGSCRPQLTRQARRPAAATRRAGDDALERGTQPAAASDAVVRMVRFACEPLDEIGPQVLAVTYWLDAPASGDPRPVTIHLTGRRMGVTHRAGPRDRFEMDTTIEHVLPGSGRVAVTTRVCDIAPGTWSVTAGPVRDPRRRGQPRQTRAGRERARSAGGSATGTTGWGPAMQVLAPGVRLGAWPALVTIGAAAGLAVQALLAAHSDVAVVPVALVSLVACMLGLVGAKVYYLLGHPKQWRTALRAGMCIQGFVIAAAGGVVGGALVARLDVGAVLDASAPGLMFGMMIGRFGCFFGGCCAGRPTASKWGLWSSDRRVGVRRIPTQLLESALAALIGVLALITIMVGTVRPRGVVFVAVIAAYILGRQLLFPFRDLPRQTSHGRVAAMTLAALVLAAAVAVGVLA